MQNLDPSKICAQFIPKSDIFLENITIKNQEGVNAEIEMEMLKMGISVPYVDVLVWGVHPYIPLNFARNNKVIINSECASWE